ncbi:MAG: T9SS C-terminal target domain-containing protein [Bacteroidetes bacterium]|nr:MAG: T9SS C-terminal target domain-containing protein [Bacteroidota bacterium]
MLRGAFLLLSLGLKAQPPWESLRIYLMRFTLIALGWSWLLGLRAEGSRELLAGNCNNHGYIQIWDNNDPLRDFATYNCPEYARLYIRVAEGERIYMGFHVIGPSNNNNIFTDVWMRLKDPNGNVVMGPIQLQPSMGPGWIDNCNQAILGPQPLVPGGYNPLVYNVPVGAGGNYYVEFAVNNDPNQRQSRMFRWFDITVARWNGAAWVERRGRVWSRKWDFSTRGANNTFVAKLYTYSKDSVVTAFDFNGMRPWGFEVSCNSFGASTVGTPQQRRRSDFRQNILNAGGIPAAPEYPVFLNDPDMEFYPTGIVASIDSFSVIPCTESSYCIYVSLSKPGQVSVTLNFTNPNRPPRSFLVDLNAGPNCIPWDGTDGNGVPVPNETVVNAVLDFYTGLTHLPLVDVEHHTNGFRIQLIRPTTRPNGTPLPPPKVYWDDVLLNDPGNALDALQNLGGCTPPPPPNNPSCHRWQNRGTNNANPEVVNTWWYTNTEQHTFVLNIDPDKWRVFSEIVSCGGPNGVEVHFWFWHEIPFSSVSWNVSTNPPGLLDPTASDTVLDTTDPNWTHAWLTFPYTGSGAGVTITFTVNATSQKYPYCRDEATLSCVVLPVVWAAELTGQVYPQYNELTWTVAAETGVVGYWVERGVNGNDFVPIQFVPAHGVHHPYRVRDDNPPAAPRWLYRLRIEEPGAPAVYSRTVELRPALLAVQVRVDPDARALVVSAPPGEKVPLEVYTLLGQLVWQMEAEAGIVPLPLPPGAYLLRTGTQTHRFFLP